MKVVPAADSHIPEIVEIWKEFMDFHGDIDPFFKVREDAHKKFDKFVRDCIKSEESRVFVVLDGDEVIGYSISLISKHPPVYFCEKYGLLQDMAVKSGYRRKGAGTALLREAFKWFGSMGVDRVELQVVSKNRIGYRFWEKHGFKDYMHVLARPLTDVEG